MQTVRADLVAEPLELQLLLQRRRRPRHSGFTRVITQTRGHIDGRRARSKVDDGSRPPLPHARQHLIDTQHSALEVDLDGAPKVFEPFCRRQLAV